MENNDKSIAKLIAALAKSQAEFPEIPRNRPVTVYPKAREDGYQPKPYSYSYADLGSVLGTCRPILAKNGIALVETLTGNVYTVSLQLEDERITSSITLEPVRNGAWQAFGGNLTYARRYLIGPLLGVASEYDDDNNREHGGEVEPHDKCADLWIALDAINITGGPAQKEWCEGVLARKLNSSDDINMVDLRVLLTKAEATKNDVPKEPPKPQASKEGTTQYTGPAAQPEQEPKSLSALLVRLNNALNVLKPWGSAKSKEEISSGKVKWCADMVGRQIPGMGNLTETEVRTLIPKAIAGEMPTLTTNAEDEPPWMKQ